MSMVKIEILQKLEALAQYNDGDIEANHGDADDLLLELIDDEEITKAYNSIKKWYA